MHCDYMQTSTAIEPLEEAHVFISALCARLLHDALEGEPVEHPQRRVHLRAHRRRTRAVVQYRQLAERVTFTHAAKRLAILDHGELASCDSSDINKYNCGWMMRNKRREIKLIGDVSSVNSFWSTTVTTCSFYTKSNRHCTTVRLLQCKQTSLALTCRNIGVATGVSLAYDECRLLYLLLIHATNHFPNLIGIQML